MAAISPVSRLRVQCFSFLSFSYSRNSLSRKKSTAFTPKTVNQTPFQYCLELVRWVKGSKFYTQIVNTCFLIYFFLINNFNRKNDYENFLAALLLPTGARESTIAVRAFNVSVAQVEQM